MDNKELILDKVLINPTRTFYVRELSRELKIHPNTIISATDELEKEKLIIKRKLKHIVEIKANFENKKFIERKRISNLRRVYESGIIEFLENKYSPKAIVLIGSYSLGEDIEKSDVDIVIITDKKDEVNLERFEKILERKIHFIRANYKNISEEFYINLINGIVLYGYIEKK